MAGNAVSRGKRSLGARLVSGLHRLGRGAVRHRWTVVGLWLLLSVALGVVGTQYYDTPAEPPAVSGSESQRALDTLSARFPTAVRPTVSIVFAPPPGRTMNDIVVDAAMTQVITAARRLPHVAEIPSPPGPSVVASDGGLAVEILTYDVPITELGERDRDALEATAARARQAGLTVEFSGSSGGNRHAPAVFALMMVLAVGAGSFASILLCFRRELAEAEDSRDAIARAMAAGGCAVLCGGLAATVSLLALSLVHIDGLAVTALAGAASVLVAMLAALTLTPALLAIGGARLATALCPQGQKRVVRRSAAGYRWTQLIARRPRPVLLVGALLLCALTLPMLALRLGLADPASSAVDSSQRRAHDLVAAHLGPGFNDPLTIVVDTQRGGGNALDAGVKVSAQLTSLSADAAVVSQPIAAPEEDLAIISLIPTTAAASDETVALVEKLRRAEPQLGMLTGGEVTMTETAAVSLGVTRAPSLPVLSLLAVVFGLLIVLLGLALQSVGAPL